MIDLDRLRVSTRGTILDAMAAIQDGGVGLCLAESGDGTFVGVLTDGDLRRALLAGATLASSVGDLVSPSPVVVGEREDRAAVLELMRALRLTAIPIVHHGRVTGLHTLQDVVGQPRRPNWVVVMAGGRGTRLGDLTTDVPKPMLPVAGRPILERIVLHALSSGLANVAISVNYKAALIEDHFGDGRRFGCSIRYLREQPDRPLGTAGSLRLLGEVGADLGHPILVVNGDVMTPAPLGPLLDAHVERGPAMTVGATVHDYQVPFGVLDIDAAERLVAIDEKPLASWRVGAGINALDPGVIELIPPDRPFDMTDLCAELMRRRLPVAVHELDSSWIDVGRPRDLALARGEVG